MSMTTKLALGSALALALMVPAQAQNPKEGDYYAPGQTSPQAASPRQEQQIREGDYYQPGPTTTQRVTPSEEQQIKEGDYYKPNKY
jgi:hypothetical protein